MNGFGHELNSSSVESGIYTNEIERLANKQILGLKILPCNKADELGKIGVHLTLPRNKYRFDKFNTPPAEECLAWKIPLENDGFSCSVPLLEFYPRIETSDGYDLAVIQSDVENLSNLIVGPIIIDDAEQICLRVESKEKVIDCMSSLGMNSHEYVHNDFGLFVKSGDLDHVVVSPSIKINAPKDEIIERVKAIGSEGLLKPEDITFTKNELLSNKAPESIDLLVDEQGLVISALSLVDKVRRYIASGHS